MSCILLFSSVGFSVNTHTCFGKVMKQGLALGTEELDCGMAMGKDKCSLSPSNSEKTLESSSCCRNESQRVELDGEFELSHGVSAVDFVFAYTFIVTHFFSQDQFINTDTYLSRGSPPIPKHSIQIRFQSFLI